MFEDDVTFMNTGNEWLLRDSTVTPYAFSGEALDNSLALPRNDDLSMRLSYRYRGGNGDASLRRPQRLDAPPSNNPMRLHQETAVLRPLTEGRKPVSRTDSALMFIPFDEPTHPKFAAKT